MNTEEFMEILADEMSKAIRFRVISKETFCGTVTHVSVSKDGNLIGVGDVIGAVTRALKESYLREMRNSENVNNPLEKHTGVVYNKTDEQEKN